MIKGKTTSHHLVYYSVIINHEATAFVAAITVNTNMTVFVNSLIKILYILALNSTLTKRFAAVQEPAKGINFTVIGDYCLTYLCMHLFAQLTSIPVSTNLFRYYAQQF